MGVQVRQEDSASSLCLGSTLYRARTGSGCRFSGFVAGERRASMSLFDMNASLGAMWDRAKCLALENGLAEYVPEAITRAMGVSTMTPEVSHP